MAADSIYPCPFLHSIHHETLKSDPCFCPKRIHSFRPTAMPQFEYKARKADGRVTTGSIEAADRRQTLQRLQQDGLRPLTVAEAKSGKSERRSKWLKSVQSLQSGHKSTAAKAAAELPRGGSPRRKVRGWGCSSACWSFVVRACRWVTRSELSANGSASRAKGTGRAALARPQRGRL